MIIIATIWIYVDWLNLADIDEDIKVGQENGSNSS